MQKFPYLYNIWYVCNNHHQLVPIPVAKSLKRVNFNLQGIINSTVLVWLTDEVVKSSLSLSTSFPTSLSTLHLHCRGGSAEQAGLKTNLLSLCIWLPKTGVIVMLVPLALHTWWWPCSFATIHLLLPIPLLFLSPFPSLFTILFSRIDRSYYPVLGKTSTFFFF